jgi:hypothetical protein
MGLVQIDLLIVFTVYTIALIVSAVAIVLVLITVDIPNWSDIFQFDGYEYVDDNIWFFVGGGGGDL